MARTRTARLGGFAFQTSANTTRFSVNILERFLSEQALRRLIPYLLLLFFAILLVGTMGHFVYGKRLAIDTARTHLSLIADTIAANMQSADQSKRADWQNRLAAALPAGATLDGRQVLLTDANGSIRATAPITAQRDGAQLDHILGKNQPVTTFGAQAGVLQLTLADGSDAFVTLRNIPNSHARITLLQPQERALASWQRDAAISATLSITTGLLLLLIGASFQWLSDRSNRAEAALATTQKDLDIALQNNAPLPHSGNERLHDAIEAISEAFVLWDSDNRLVMCNDKYQQFYNLGDVDVLPGAPYESVIAAAAAPVVHTRITVSDDNGSSAHTYEAQLEDGNWLHIDERRTKDGGYVSVGTDITSLKQSQQRHAKSEKELKATITDLRHSRRELEQQKQQLVDLMEKYALEKNRAEDANRAKSEFLANISHELRTPLNAVIGFSEVMKNGLFGPVGNQKYVEYARDIHESGNHLLEVINDVLDMSKIEAGRINLDFKPLDAGEIIVDSLRIMAPAAEERSIEVKQTGLKKMNLRADKRALKQILLNLLSNAVKFTPQDGKVTVRLSKAKDYAKITIADTGIGIPASEIGKLGRPFEQVENQLTKTRKGSGLGLAISKSLVEMHGGKFEMKSSVSEGTTVICHLPLKPTHSTNSAESNA